MLNLIGIVAVSHGHGLLSLLATLAGLGALGVTIAPLFKNSGILRYTFGDVGNNSNPAAGQFPALAAASTKVIQCLGAGSDVLIADSDNQLFGGSPGHDIVSGGINTLFDPANPTPVLAQQPTDVLVANPPPGGHGAPSFYIPSGTKVFAFFIQTGGVTPGAYRVQWETSESVIRRGLPGNGNSVAQANAPAQFLASIRVALRNDSGSQSIAGVLVVELQHSEHDIPGDTFQSAGYFAPTAG